MRLKYDIQYEESTRYDESDYESEYGIPYIYDIEEYDTFIQFKIGDNLDTYNPCPISNANYHIYDEMRKCIMRFFQLYYNSGVEL